MHLRALATSKHLAELRLPDWRRISNVFRKLPKLITEIFIGADLAPPSTLRRKQVNPRLEYNKVSPQAVQAMYALEKFVRESGLEPSLLELIKMRASQINGCAYCIDMHSKDARTHGETEQRLYALAAWRETPFFTDRERAALEWTESLTLVSGNHVPDEIFERVRQHFNSEELVALSMAIVTINSWNRLAIAFRAVPGTYQPAQQQPLRKGA